MTIKQPFLTVIFSILLICPIALFAFEDTSTAYSGTRIVKSEQGTFTLKVFHTFGKDRTEITAEGQQMATIIRRDKDIAWQLMPQMNIYMEMPIEKAQVSDMSSGNLLEKKKVGTDRVSGHDTTKYKIRFENDDGSQGEGFIWLTSEDILMKMVAEIYSDGQRYNVETVMTTLHISSQPDKLFEIPSGYKKMTMPGKYGQMSGKPSESYGSTDQNDQSKDDEDSSMAGDIAGEVGNAAKDEAVNSTKQGIQSGVRDTIRGLFGK